MVKVICGESNPSWPPEASVILWIEGWTPRNWYEMVPVHLQTQELLLTLCLVMRQAIAGQPHQCKRLALESLESGTSFCMPLLGWPAGSCWHASLTLGLSRFPKVGSLANNTIKLFLFGYGHEGHEGLSVAHELTRWSPSMRKELANDGIAGGF